MLYVLLSVGRYLDSVTNKDSTLPPIPHLHSLLTDNGDPHPEVDIFKLVRSSYEVLKLEDNADYFYPVKSLRLYWILYRWIYDYECVTPTVCLPIHSYICLNLLQFLTVTHSLQPSCFPCV